ncbi:hypothetical protein ACH4E7_06595 [Kitasatospora sp. NPDC018058]|uniref:hypothetical protein n=1 Tax=Kitasatospora sp. NPDC018058 TaxID=3364025 RepID=UPI0037C121FA
MAAQHRATAASLTDDQAQPVDRWSLVVAAGLLSFVAMLDMTTRGRMTTPGR